MLAGLLFRLARVATTSHEEEAPSARLLEPTGGSRLAKQSNLELESGSQSAGRGAELANSIPLQRPR